MRWARLSVMDRRAFSFCARAGASYVADTRCLVGSRARAGWDSARLSRRFVTFPTARAACNRKSSTARLGHSVGYPLPFCQRVRVCPSIIKKLHGDIGKGRLFLSPRGDKRWPCQEWRREKSARCACSITSTGVGKIGRLHRADFSRKAVGRRCLPVWIFSRTRRGNRCGCNRCRVGRPVFGRPRPGRAESASTWIALRFPELLFNLFPCRTRYVSPFVAAKVWQGADRQGQAMFPKKSPPVG